ncbi:hypothetical protein M758_10G141800 [Ceratodon purpureus]|uniref:Uncharacterized protein n=1 Tax=Ceratodon purpureus TaxID=3225 RepID=A0A8T0GN43_CERPU|nr:hypothetical protein KC19_10G146800 [Ceratodon purpureus]KAG0604066.1 hypothetical protein M758_10G141800 [Ceratodon purpureus]
MCHCDHVSRPSKSHRNSRTDGQYESSCRARNIPSQTQRTKNFIKMGPTSKFERTRLNITTQKSHDQFLTIKINTAPLPTTMQIPTHSKNITFITKIIQRHP